MQNSVCPHSGDGFLSSTTRFLGRSQRPATLGPEPSGWHCFNSCPLSCLESSGLLSGALLVLPTSVFLGTRQKIAFDCFLHFLMEYSGPEGQSW